MLISWLTHFLSQTWWQGVAGIAQMVAALVSIGAVIVTILWDRGKVRKERRARFSTVMTAVNDDLAANKVSLAMNTELLEVELEALEQSKSINQPLEPMKTGFGDHVRIILPSEMLSAYTLVGLRQLARRLGYVNESIRSRESYRMFNRAMSNYCVVLQGMDRFLLGEMTELTPVVHDLAESVRGTSDVGEQMA